MIRARFLFVLAFGLLLPSSLWGQQWRVTNNLDERFTVIVWPESNDTQVSQVVVPRGQTREVPLGQDRHEIQLVSGGGNIYMLEPAKLRGRGQPTLLKDILTPKERKVNGRIAYNYMNQNGFNKGDNAGNIQSLSHSNWNSEYLDPDDNKVKARLSFKGDEGTYTTSQFTGQLSRVRYRTKGDDGRIIVDGQWSLGEQKGQFKFNLNTDLDKFDGQWTRDGQKWRPWTGTQTMN